MDSKIQNIILKSVTYVIAVVGVIFTLWVIRAGNPFMMGPEEIEQLGVHYVKENKLDNEKLSQSQLNKLVKDWGEAEHERLEKEQKGNVSTIMNFTIVVLYITIAAIILGFIYLIVVDWKKALISLAGISAIILFIKIVLMTAGNEVPVELVVKEYLKTNEEPQMFTPDNWHLASAAYTSTVILAGTALIAWVGGEIAKFFR